MELVARELKASGRCGPLLGRTPLRTGRATFTASGSSLSEARCHASRSATESGQRLRVRADLAANPWGERCLAAR